MTSDDYRQQQSVLEQLERIADALERLVEAKILQPDDDLDEDDLDREFSDIS